MKLNQAYVTLIAKPVLLFLSVMFSVILTLILKYSFAFSALIGIGFFILISVHHYFIVVRAVKKIECHHIEPVVIAFTMGVATRKATYLTKTSKGYREVIVKDDRLQYESVQSIKKEVLNQAFNYAYYKKAPFDFIRVK